MKVSVFGESHGKAIGVVIEGFPAGILINEEKIMTDMRRRMPKKAHGGTPRTEADIPQILSGVKDGYTTGAPIAAVIVNENQRSGDYQTDIPRPGHADFTAMKKWNGFADLRGGGHFSGRLTAPIVFAGAIAREYLSGKGIEVGSHIASIGSIDDAVFTDVSEELLQELRKENFPLLDRTKEKDMLDAIASAAQDADSIGGTIEAAATGLRVGLGGYLEDGVESIVARRIFAVPAVKGVSFGAKNISRMRGSDANDGMTIEQNSVKFLSNHAGGILGGITTGEPLIVRAEIKPTPSIGKPQRAVNIKTGEEVCLAIKGRHDACIVPRAACVIEAELLLSIMEMMV